MPSFPDYTQFVVFRTPHFRQDPIQPFFGVFVLFLYGLFGFNHNIRFLILAQYSQVLQVDFWYLNAFELLGDFRLGATLALDRTDDLEQWE